MEKVLKSIKTYWYFYVMGVLLFGETLVFLIFREESYLQIHDNLDLFMAHYQMLKLNNGWYAQNAQMPMLHGIDRDLLGSEFLLYNAFYILLPGVWAYFAGMAAKIVIGLWSFRLLCKDVLKEKYSNYKALVWITATAFALIPVFPTYGIAFTSVPLIILILRRIYLGKTLVQIKGENGTGKEFFGRILLYLAVFCYPVFSYFSYHGFFILCYMCLAVIILWIKDKKFPGSIFISICVLSFGYISFEYRLFKAMLFDDTVTIRTTMNHGNLSLSEALKTSFEEFVRASFHNQDSHTYLVLFIVLIALIIVNVTYIKNGQAKKMLSEPINLLMVWIIFNCLIFGLYEYEPFRNLVEILVPKLKGFEFARTAYFNTLLWYLELLAVLIKLYDFGKSNGKKVFVIGANLLSVAAVLVVMFVPQVYNDFYYTCYNQAYKILLHKETSTVNYREFYSKDLFAEIKEEIGYDGEWAAAYGFHPAVLQYNGISTVDGYLGMYPEAYKQKWIKIEEPAFNGSPSLKDYFEGWGARVSLYSGSDENTYAPLRIMDPSDKRLVVDMEELKTLSVKYIFSRIELSNSEELGIDLAGTFSKDSSPYTIYLYEVN